MTITVAVRCIAATLLVVSGSARAGETASATADPARPPSAAPPAARDGRPARAAQDPTRKPAPAVLVLPLIGLVLLPLTLPVAQPRVRIPVGDVKRPPAAGGPAAATPTPTPAATAAPAPTPVPTATPIPTGALK